MKRRERLPVIFRIMRRKDAEVTAIFPTLPFDRHGAQLTCYAHVGQHGGASWDWYHGRTHRPATRKEYRPLLRELRGIYGRKHGWGDTAYALVPVRKITRAMRAAFYAEVLRIAGGAP